QHRLSACAEADRAIDTLVTFGVDDDAFKYMDTGIARIASHVFAIEGIEHHAFCAAALRIVMYYTSVPNWTGQTNGRPDNDELLEVFQSHRGIVDSYAAAMKLRPLMQPRWGG